MQYYRVVFNVTELNQLVRRELASIFFRLYNAPVASDGYTLEQALLYWYRRVLHRDDQVMFAVGPQVYASRDGRLLTAIHSEIHPAYEGLVDRTVLLPWHLRQVEVENLSLTERELTLFFDKHEVSRQEHYACTLSYLPATW